MSNERGDIKGMGYAFLIIAAMIILPPILIAMSFDQYPRYCKLTPLLPCIGVNDDG